MPVDIPPIESPKVLHLETALIYSGSTVILQRFLERYNTSRFRHDILFRWPTTRERHLELHGAFKREGIRFLDVTEGDVEGREYVSQERGAALHTGPTGADERIPLRQTLGYIRYIARRLYPRARQFAKYIRREGVSHLQLHNGPAGNLAAMMAARQAGIGCTGRLQSFLTLNLFERRFASRMDYLLCVSDAIRDHYIAQGLPKETVNTVLDGVLEADLIPPSGTDTLKREIGIPEDAPLVSLVGKLSWWKGHETFVDAAAIINKARPDVHFTICSGPEQNEPNYLQVIEAKIAAHGLQDRVKLMGFRSDARRFTATASVSVLASALPEPSGNAILEAMAVGTPAIATNGGGMPDYIMDGETGLLVPPQDPAAMAEAILEFLNDPAKAARVALAAQKRMRECFLVDTSVKRTEDIFAEAIARRRTRLWGIGIFLTQAGRCVLEAGC